MRTMRHVKRGSVLTLTGLALLEVSMNIECGPITMLTGPLFLSFALLRKEPGTI